MFRSLIARGLAALALTSLVVAAPAFADITVKDGAGAAQTLGTTTCNSGSQCYKMDTVIQASATDIGASVTANAATTIAAANAARRGFALQNQTGGSCYLSGAATATADYHSLLIAAGAYYESKDSHVGTGALSVICAAAGGLYGRQW